MPCSIWSSNCRIPERGRAFAVHDTADQVDGSLAAEDLFAHPEMLVGNDGLEGHVHPVRILIDGRDVVKDFATVFPELDAAGSRDEGWLDAAHRPGSVLQLWQASSVINPREYSP
jgi:hypothetical protein